MELNWKNPPADRSPKSKSAQNDEAAKALRENPGVWALMYEGVSSPSRVSTWQKRGMETQSRSQIVDGVRRYDIYARFNPDA